MNRPVCSRCQTLHTECSYDTERGESRWSAIRRRNRVLEIERDEARELIAQIRSRPESEAQEIYRRIRAETYTSDMRTSFHEADSAVIDGTWQQQPQQPQQQPQTQHDQSAASTATTTNTAANTTTVTTTAGHELSVPVWLHSHRIHIPAPSLVVDSRSADVGIQRDTTTTPALLVLDAANHEPDVRNVERLVHVFIIP
jgi:hypothetical protein